MKESCANVSDGEEEFTGLVPTQFHDLFRIFTLTTILPPCYFHENSNPFSSNSALYFQLNF